MVGLDLNGLFQPKQFGASLSSGNLLSVRGLFCARYCISFFSRCKHQVCPSDSLQVGFTHATPYPLLHRAAKIDRLMCCLTNHFTREITACNFFCYFSLPLACWKIPWTFWTSGWFPDSPAKNILWDPFHWLLSTGGRKSSRCSEVLTRLPVLPCHMPVAFKTFTAHVRHRKSLFCQFIGLDDRYI